MLVCGEREREREGEGGGEKEKRTSGGDNRERQNIREQTKYD